MSASVFAGSVLVLYVAIAAVLIRKYRRTRDAGFIWLGVALIVWPLLSGLISQVEGSFIDRLVRHQTVGYWPFTLVERGATTLGSLITGLAAGQRLISLILLLIAIAYLRRTNGNRPVISGS